MLNIENSYPKIFKTLKKTNFSNKKIFIFTITFQWINFLVIIASILLRRGNRINFYYNTFYDQDKDFFSSRFSNSVLNKIDTHFKKNKNLNFNTFNIFDKKIVKYKLAPNEIKLIKDQTKKDLMRITKDIANNIQKKNRLLYFDRLNKNKKTYIFFKNLFKSHKPDVFIVPNCNWYEWAIAYNVAKSYNIKCICIESFKGIDHKNFVIDKNYPPANFDEQNVIKYWKNKNKINIQEDLIERFAKIQNLTVQKNKIKGLDISEIYNIPNNKKKILILPSFTWEKHPRLNRYCFSSQNEWIEKTIKYLKNRKDIYIIFKCHPYPSQKKFRKKFEQNINDPFKIIKKYKSIKNLKVIEPDSKIHIDDIYNFCDIAITYYSMAGLEMSLKGKKVIVCTNFHFANKNFTLTPINEANYFKILNDHIIQKFEKKKLQWIQNQAKIYFNMFYNNMPFALPYNIALPNFNFEFYNINNFETFHFNLSDFGKTINYLEGEKFNKKKTITKCLNHYKKVGIIHKFSLLFSEIRSILQFFVLRKMYHLNFFIKYQNEKNSLKKNIIRKLVYLTIGYRI